MINDKRITELKETIAEQKTQLQRQAQQLLQKDAEIKELRMEKDAQIRNLEAEIGVISRTLMTFGDRLTKEGKI